MVKKNVYQTFYGLPSDVRFCKHLCISNQKPISQKEFEHKKNTSKQTVLLDENNVSDMWKYQKLKKNIDWDKRELELLKLLDKHRGKYGKYDCIVPGSGGKDSSFASHILKYKYGMNPLTVTWKPLLYTSYGKKNFNEWLSTGNFDNITDSRDERTTQILVKLSFMNLLHPFQTFMLGQYYLAPKISLKTGIPLIFYGESEAEYGNPLAEGQTSLREQSRYTYKNIDNLFLGGVKIKDIIKKYNIRDENIKDFIPPQENEFHNKKIEVHYLGYYLYWLTQEVYYYAVQNSNFLPRPFRSDGTYTKFSSIDDKFDDLHWYTLFIKFGIGRATYNASEDIRNNYLSTYEGKKLIGKYDGEKPKRYIKDLLEYLDMNINEFDQHIDKFRSPHLWGKNINGEYKLRHNVNLTGLDD